MSRRAAPHSLKVVRTAGPLRGQVVDKLRRAVVDGVFLPGERLVERRLVELLGVSRTLVREALRQLEAEGFVETLPYRGPAVAMLTVAQVRQIYEMRSALEGLAAELFVARASDAECAALAAAVDAIVRFHAAKNFVQQRRAVERFYDLLLRGARNEMLTQAVTAQRARLEWLRGISLSRRGRSIESIVEKRAIVAAIQARKGGRARALTEAHIAAAMAAAVQLLEEIAAPRAENIA